MASLGIAQLGVDVAAKAIEIALQPMKHTLDLELLGEPCPLERAWVGLEYRTHAGTEHTTGELLPQDSSVFGTREIQRDLPVVEPVIVGELPEEEGMNELMDEVW